MKLYSKVKYSIKQDFSWLFLSGLDIKRKLAYIISKYLCLVIHRNRIFFIKGLFYYDNRNTPVTLQTYPSEIQFLDHYINLSNIANVLDIGANIGQFSVTLASMFPELNIYSFEANPDIFDLLSKNTSRFNSIHAISKAVGPEGVMPFYYVPGKSAKGSFVRSNAVINIDGSTVKKVDIDVVELNHFGAQDIELPKKYDLIKIDVEGFEYVVLDALNGIKTDYIYIEFSQALRNPNYSIHDLLDKIRAIFGKCDVIFCDEINREETIGNLLAKVT